MNKKHISNIVIIIIRNRSKICTQSTFGSTVGWTRSIATAVATGEVVGQMEVATVETTVVVAADCLRTRKK